jgi:hypothetical protein
MLLAQRRPNLTDLAPPQKDEVATMVADCRHVSVLDCSQVLGHTQSLTIEGPTPAKREFIAPQHNVRTCNTRRFGIQ